MSEERAPEAEAHAPLLQRLTAEFAGAALLVAVGSGAATVAAIQVDRSVAASGPAFAGAEPNAFIIELFKGAFSDIVPVALAFSFVLAVIVYAFGGISGGHFNPAVTFALSATRRFPWTEAVPYWVAQCAGAIVGALVIAGIYGEVGATAGDPEALFGATRIADGVTQWGAILAEAFITFVLVTAIMAIAVDPRAPKGWSGLVIGIALGGGILVTGAATGGSANFARSLGPLVASLFYDVRSIPWGELTVYAAGPVIGGTAAAFLYESVSGLERVAPVPRPGAATPAEAAVVPDEESASAEVAETAAPVVAEDERADERGGDDPDEPFRP